MGTWGQSHTQSCSQRAQLASCWYLQPLVCPSLMVLVPTILRVHFPYQDLERTEVTQETHISNTLMFPPRATSSGDTEGVIQTITGRNILVRRITPSRPSLSGMTDMEDMVSTTTTSTTWVPRNTLLPTTHPSQPMVQDLKMWRLMFQPQLLPQRGNDL